MYQYPIMIADKKIDRRGVKILKVIIFNPVKELTDSKSYIKHLNISTTTYIVGDDTMHCGGGKGGS